MVLLKQEIAAARSLALLRAGSNMAARIAMIAMTTSNSINVKADLRGVVSVRKENVFIAELLIAQN